MEVDVEAEVLHIASLLPLHRLSQLPFHLPSPGCRDHHFASGWYEDLYNFNKSLPHHFSLSIFFLPLPIFSLALSSHFWNFTCAVLQHRLCHICEVAVSSLLSSSLFFTLSVRAKSLTGQVLARTGAFIWSLHQQVYIRKLWILQNNPMHVQGYGDLDEADSNECYSLEDLVRSMERESHQEPMQPFSYYISKHFGLALP